MRTVSRRIGIILSSCVFSLSASALERNISVNDSAGEVVSVHGTVFVRYESNGKAQQPFAIQPGQNVFAGDVINTSSDGSIKILLKDKTIVDLGASSLFKVAQFKPKSGGDREVDLDMKFGRLRVSVSRKITGTGKFNVKTRAATMGVRGTEFVVQSALGESGHGQNAPKTDVTVLQGRVDVKAASVTGALPQINSLTAGAQISAQVGVPSAVVQLNDTQLANTSANSKIADNTFTRAITIEATPERHTSSDRSPAGRDSPKGEANASAPLSPPAGSLAGEVASMAAAAPSVPVSYSEIGVPGAPSVVNVSTSPVNPVNRSYRVTVIVGQ